MTTNTGNWNTGNRNTGYMNTITPDECLIFNEKGSRKEWRNTVKPDWLSVETTKWISETDMSDKEKESNPSYVTTTGYLKFYSSIQHAYIEAWEKASDEDRALTFKLPNFDTEVFKEIFGFTPVMKETEELTLAEVCKELGRDIKITK